MQIRHIGILQAIKYWEWEWPGNETTQEPRVKFSLLSGCGKGFLCVQREEQRVASLESKLSELSATVGNYDRQREMDFTAIQ